MENRRGVGGLKGATPVVAALCIAVALGACAGTANTAVSSGGLRDGVAAASTEEMSTSMAQDDGSDGADAPFYVARAGRVSATGGGPEVQVTLSDVDATVLWFQDHPGRDASEIRMSEFVGGWEEAGFADDPPNAVIRHAGDGGAARPATSSDPGVVVEISDPVWDQVSTTLRFTARTAAGQDPLPTTMHDVSLFVEDPERPSPEQRPA